MTSETREALRAKNLVPAAGMPYTSATGITYDVGDYPATLDKANTLAGMAELRAEQARLRRVVIDRTTLEDLFTEAPA